MNLLSIIDAQNRPYMKQLKVCGLLELPEKGSGFITWLKIDLNYV